MRSSDGNISAGFLWLSIEELLVFEKHTATCPYSPIFALFQALLNIKSLLIIVIWVSNNYSADFNTSFNFRLGLPSLLNRHPGPIHNRPSYMAMTSAAERKRKLLRQVK